MAALGMLSHAGAAQEGGEREPFSCVRDARPMPQPPIREADVMWARRIWRTIDLRQKMNLPLYAPGDAAHGCPGLFEVLSGAVLTGELQAYDPGVLLNDDAFTRSMTVTELLDRLHRSDTLWTADLLTGEEGPVVVSSRVEPEQVTRYWIKEDWIFDKQRSAVDIRVIGLAPLVEVLGPDGELRGHAPLFWLHVPSCRPVLARALAPGRWNDATRPSFDDILQKRLFQSTIHKVSNVHDRPIHSHKAGLDALLEAEREHQRLLQSYWDLWEY